MSEEKYEQEASCSHDCSTCGSNCSSRQKTREDFYEPYNKDSKIKKVIGIVSGKGGVGKSFVTSYLANLTRKKGFNVGILDADITGPSIPQAFGIHERAAASEMGILPALSKSGIEVMSVNLLLDNEESPVVWRGPVIAGVVKQFWQEVFWGDVDYLFVDMPPGTGDVALTVFQSIKLDGIIVVTTPQDLVSMIVAKAVNMAKMMEIPILGLVENYSYIECPDCGRKVSVFGESKIEEVAAKHGIEVLAKLPIDPLVASYVDSGKIEEYECTYFDGALAKILEKAAITE
ncbi:MAG: Mrp/NBP35 family ATP-binding protein [Lachnospiraceae bacterium]|nr:Mrp/NBP35 family ATP-binding protein [Lachnospiraceae bacterium]